MAGELVAPEIASVVGDTARPRAPVPFATELAHLPGRTGFLVTVEMVVGLVRHGEEYLRRLVEKNGPVFRHQAGADAAVYVADPDLVWTIARNEDRAWSAAIPWSHFFLGLAPGATADGPLMLDGDPHRDARRLLQPAFTAQALAGYLDGARQIYDQTIDEWLARGRVPFKAAVRRMFAAVSARIFMGIDNPREAEMLDRAMTDGWQAVLALKKRSRFSIAWRRARRGYEDLWKAIHPRMKAKKAGTDLLSRMSRVDDASWLDDDARTRLFIAVMFGAFDTTSSGAASMAYLLAKNPSWQERLRAESKGLAATAPSPDEMKKLEQQELVWKETLRLYPVGGQIIRMALRDTKLGEHRVPARTLVWALSGTLGRDPKFWGEPTAFDPERFSKERAEDKKHKAIFLPFGAGAHACIGAQLAGLEIKAFWHSLLLRCRFSLAKDYRARHSYAPIGVVSGDVDLLVERL